jgi:hypothetical protein
MTYTTHAARLDFGRGLGYTLGWADYLPATILITYISLLLEELGYARKS